MEVNTDKLLEYIKNSKYFGKLPEKEMQDLLPLFESLILKPGELLLLQGQSSDYLYLLIEGQLAAFLQNEAGHTFPMGIINPGETVGELGALSGEHRSLSIESVTDCLLLKLPSATFRELCNHHPSFTSEISKTVIARAMQTMRMIGHDKPVYNITIIYPFLKNFPIKLLKARFKEYLGHFPVEFIATDELEFIKLKNKLTHLTSKPLYIFISELNTQVLNFLINKAKHFYLILYETEIQASSLFTKELYEKIKSHPQLRFNLILLHPPHAGKISMTQQFLELASFKMLHHLRVDKVEDYKRIVRFMTGNAYTLVFGGGGVKGLVHLGVIKAMLEKNIPIDAIGGTSVGATIGGCYVHAKNYDEASSYVHRLKKTSLDSLKSWQLTWPIISLYSAKLGTKELQDIFGDQCIENLSTPFFAVSANLSESCEKVHHTGPLWETIRASVAIPGVFPPIVRDSHLLFDGGLLNNLPIDIMREMIGQDNKIIAVSLTLFKRTEPLYKFPPVLKLSDTLLYKMGMAHRDWIFPSFFFTFRSSLLLGSSANEKRHALAANILIHPNLDTYSLLSLNVPQEKALLDIGYQEGIRAIDKYIIKK